MGTRTESTFRIGLDDTDHPDGGCTTFDLNSLTDLLVSEVPSFLEIERRLVRLWPYAERRTRGNAALCLVASVNDEDEGALYRVLEDWVPEPSGEDGNSSARPAIVMGRDTPPVEWYTEAVRSHVDLDERLHDIASSDYKIFTKSERPHGAIGASAAIAWDGGRSTWELVAWREQGALGTRRVVDEGMISSMSERYPGTFANRDPTTGRCMIAPRTPCPVLYGIRGRSVPEIKEAHRWLQSSGSNEHSPNFAIHRTNQCSDDHVVGAESGTVVTGPVVAPGGHTHLIVHGSNGSESLVAFKEGGPVNKALRGLHIGDRIHWVGLRAPDGSIHLERLMLFDQVPVAVGRPMCCGKAMKSSGSNAGLRCSKCNGVANRAWISTSTREQGTWSEPQSSNRRHLARPLNQGEPHLAEVESTSR